ncbi:hypothetical protein SDC9_94584 [bioreactor metagenome]|uniref:Uncharacterized protein n=1 Tax=bioreactor metagenome TaxID=1076179 RepID=A0A645AAL6_9ZZZZ
MRGEVVGDVQQRGDVAHAFVVAEQVVIVQVRHVQLAQHVEQVVELLVDLEGQLEAFGLGRHAQRNALVGGGGEREEHGLIGQVLGKLAHVAHGAACAVVQHGQHDRQPGVADASDVERQAVGASRVGLHELVHVAGVAGVQARQLFHGGALARALAVAKAHATGVQHEGVEQVQIAPAGTFGALAEVILFAVALAEILHVEKADVV